MPVLGSAGALVIVNIVGVAVGAPLLAPYDPTAIDVSHSLHGPTWGGTAAERHWFGTGWSAYARIVRASVLSLREREYMQAARALGIGDGRILFRHVLPNVLAPIIVLASFGVASNIINESSLSFLGLGVKPSTATWGSILADGRDYVRDAWWLTTFADLATMVTVAAINVMGDWLRDYLDPRLRVER